MRRPNNNPKLYYIESQLSKWTFDDPKILEFVVSRCEGFTLNLYAGKNRLIGIDEIRIDKDPIFRPDYCMTDGEFLVKNKWMFQTLVWDPPWNGRKDKEFYDGDGKIGKFTKWKDLISSKILPGGKIIGVGFEISNFGWKRGFVIEELVTVNNFGEFRPWFISIERKVR